MFPNKANVKRERNLRKINLSYNVFYLHQVKRPNKDYQYYKNSKVQISTNLNKLPKDADNEKKPNNISIQKNTDRKRNNN